jgi:hypothetical protein
MIDKRKPSSLDIYEQYRPQIKTGDVVAFSGTSGFSKFIKLFTKSRYSHVGIIVKSETEMFGDTIFIVESTTELGMTNADGRQVIKGVQTHFLSQRLAMYRGGAWIFPLKEPLSIEGSQKMVNWLRSIYAQAVPYDSVQIFGAGLDVLENAFGLQNKPDYTRLFCSELVTQALLLGGALSLEDHINPSSQTPAEVTQFPCFAQPLQVKAHNS